MSSSTATLTVPAATPHLRAVRSVQPPADRRRPQSLTRPAAAPSAPAVLPVPATPAQPPAVPLLPVGLPEGATVVALPQSALPANLLAQYGAGGAHPLVGYLVLVPADQAVPATSAATDVTAAPVAAVAAPGPAAVPSERGIGIDTDRRNAYVDGRLLELTYLEFELLAHLTAHPYRVHTRDHLVTAVWGYGHIGDGRTVDVHVARLRRKLGPAYRDSIVTVRRVGYKYLP